MTAGFDDWLPAEFDRTGPFTALIVLVRVAAPEVSPLCSTYVNVVGPEVDWDEISLLLAGSGVPWDGAAFFVATGEGGGALPNVAARTRLREIEAAVAADRLQLNQGHFFDREGRRIQVEPLDVAGHA